MAPLRFTTVKPSRVGHLTHRAESLHFELTPDGNFPLAYSAIKTVTLDKALLFGGATVSIRLRDGTQLPELKRQTPSLIELKVKKSDIEQATEFVKTTSFELMENSVDDLLDFMDENT